MFTVKTIDRKRREDIFCNVEQVTFTPKGPDSDAASLIVSYAGDDVSQEFTWDLGFETAYVVNEHGKTVGTYEL